jgi:hypothetical protein
MRTLICTYLLLKSFFGRTFNYFDIGLAKLLMECFYMFESEAPAYLMMIGNLTAEDTLPEVWSDFIFELIN